MHVSSVCPKVAKERATGYRRLGRRREAWKRRPRKLHEERDPVFRLPPPKKKKKKRKISKEIGGKVSWSVVAVQRRETETKFTFVSFVEGWGKSPDPPRVRLDPCYQGAWKDRMDRRPCLGRAWGGASRWAGQLSLWAGFEPQNPPPLFLVFLDFIPPPSGGD